MTDAIENIKAKYWERGFPGCLDDFVEIFGTASPSPRVVADWKASWIESTPHKIYLGNEKIDLLLSSEMKQRINDTCKEAGIHPYLWEFWKDQRDEWIEREGSSSVTSEKVTVLIPYISFYKGDHLVMFKLRWGI